MRARFIVAAASSLAACHSSSIVVGDLQEVTTLRAIPNPNLDLLFVIDNSYSMAEQQASLAASFPRMIDVLDQLDGDLPNLHIGVVTTDMGTSTLAGPSSITVGTIGAGGCAGDGEGGVLRGMLSDVALPDGTRARNYSGELRDAFAQLAQVGANGCGFEQPLSAMRAALLTNAGFFRPEANLAVVIIADEDDCSARDPALFSSDDATYGLLDSFRCTRFGLACDQPDMNAPGTKTNCAPNATSPVVADITPFVDALLAAKNDDPRAVMVAAIVGPPEPVEVTIAPQSGQTGPLLVPSCTFAGPAGEELADPAVRLAAFLDAFPGRSQLTSICSADLSGALTQIGGTAKKLLGDPCLDAPDLADASADPGLQPACEVLDVRDSAPELRTLLPACLPGGTDCFEIAADPVACPAAPDHLRIRLRRTTTPAADTWTHVRCQRAEP